MLFNVNAAIPGDADGDGKITSNDSALVLQYTLNGIWSGKTPLENCDVTGNGTIDAADAASILQKALVSTFTFKVEEKPQRDFVIAEKRGNIFLTAAKNFYSDIELTDVDGKTITCESEDDQYKILVIGTTESVSTKYLLMLLDDAPVISGSAVVAAFVDEEASTDRVLNYIGEDITISSSAVSCCPYSDEAANIKQDMCELLGVYPDIAAAPLTIVINPKNKIEMVSFGTPNVYITISRLISGELVVTTESTTETTTATTTVTTTSTTTTETTTQTTTSTTTTETTTQTTTVTTTEATTEAATAQTVKVPDNMKLDISGSDFFYLEQPASSLPTPSRIDNGFEGCYWYIYNNSGNDYLKYTQVGVVDGYVKVIYTMSDEFKYLDYGYNSTVSDSGRKDSKNRTIYTLNGKDLTLDPYYMYYIYKDDSARSVIYFDPNSNNRIYATMILTSDFVSEEDYYSEQSSERMHSVTLEIFEIVNAFRKQNGKSVLTYSDALSAASQAFAEDMAQYNYFPSDHTSRDGKTAEQRIQDSGVRYSRATGENILSGEWSAMGAVNAWIESPLHHEVMLYREFRTTGVGMAYGDNATNNTRFVQDFCG